MKNKIFFRFINYSGGCFVILFLSKLGIIQNSRILFFNW